MNPQTANIVASILGAIGLIFILAGVFGVVSMNYGLFTGITGFVIAGVIKRRCHGRSPQRPCEKRCEEDDHRRQA